jgi:hypothetical protein
MAGGEGPELDHEHHQHQRGGDARAPAAARGRPGAATSYCPPTSARCSRPGSLTPARRLDLLDRAAEVRPLQAGGDGGHLAQVLALQIGSSRWPSVGEAANGRHLAVRAAHRRLGQAGGIQRRVGIAHAHGMVRSSRRSSVATSPSQAACSCCETCSMVRPRAARWPMGSMVQVTSGVPLSTPPRRRVPFTFSTSGSISSPRAARPLGVVAEDLTSIRDWAGPRGPRSCPGRAAARLDLQPRRPASWDFRAQISSMTSSALRLRCPRGLQPDEDVPLLGWVRRGPSSDPVRREKEATSGVSATIFSTLRSAVLSLPARCRPGSGSR